jgi:hypothetical protein
MGGICLLFRAATADFYRSPYKMAVEADHSWVRVGLDGRPLLLEGHPRSGQGTVHILLMLLQIDKLATYDVFQVGEHHGRPVSLLH